jgi:hypothetical protein
MLVQRLVPTALCIAAAASLTAAVEQVVDFAPVTDAITVRKKLSTSTPWGTQVSEAADYAIVPSSPVFYGGFSGGGNFMLTEFNDLVRFGPSNQVHYVGALSWQKADFLAGSTATVDITADSALSASIAVINGNNGGDFRWLFVNEGTVYVSEAADVPNTQTTVSSGDLTAMTWYTVDLAADMESEPVAATPDFADIEGVGIYFISETNPHLGDTNRGADLFAFSANLATGGGTPAIPNLSAIAVSHEEIQLAWDSVTPTGTDPGYEIWRDDNADDVFEHVANVAEDGSTSYTWNDSGLSANTTYQYRVDAVDDMAVVP